MSDAASASPPVIECRGVRRVFQAGGQPFHALRGVDLCVAPGELLAIVGASGSGKSTLLNLIGGLDKPTAGDVQVAGQSLVALAEPALADLRNRHLGFIFQQFQLLARYDALRNIELPLVYAGWPKAARRARSQALLAQLGLSSHGHKRPSQMSGGQQQRLAIARALSNRPKIILADEPTGALDSVTGGEVLQLLTMLNRESGITVLLVTHDPAVAARCDRTVTMADGLVASDTRRAIAAAQAPCAPCEP